MYQVLFSLNLQQKTQVQEKGGFQKIELCVRNFFIISQITALIKARSFDLMDFQEKEI